MALSIYLKPSPDSKVSSTNPFTITLDGEIGGARDIQLYIRNDNEDRWYNNIQVLPYDSHGNNIVDGTITGWFWRVLEKDVAPTTEEWLDVAAGNTITLTSNIGSSTLGDTSTYLPFWVRVAIPRWQLADNITRVVLRLSATENLVGV